MQSNAPSDNFAQARHFLELLLADKPLADLDVVLWTAPDGRTHRFATSELDAAARLAVRAAANRDVYLGCTLQRSGFVGTGRGKATDAAALPGLWLDIDIAGPAHKQDQLPPTCDAARELLDAWPLPPTILIHSGHGLQARWLLQDGPWVFAGPHDRDHAAGLTRRFQQAFDGLADARGWKLDNVSDLARVLRLPGTLNRKLEPEPVVILEADPSRRYSLAQLTEAVDTTLRQLAPRPPDRRPRPSDAEPSDPTGDPPADELPDGPLGVVLGRLADAGGRPRRGRGDRAGWMARCPAHDDRQPSLSVRVGDQQPVLVYCHAGCHPEEVLAALGLSWDDLRPPSQEHDRPRQTFPYVDEHGEVLFEVVREPGKRFWQRRPTPDGGWTPGLGDTRRVLFRLPQVLAAATTEQTIYVVEGEKDVEALRAAGQTATCNPGGAGKWRDEYAQALAGAQVVVVADRDDPGRRHAARVATSVGEVAASVQVVEAAEGKDAADHLAAGHGVDALRPVDIDELVSQAPASAGDKKHGPPWPPTDLGNAERLVSRHGQDLRYCPSWKTWLVWDGLRWVRDTNGEVRRRAFETVRAIPDETTTTDGASPTDLLKWAGKSEHHDRLRAMINLAQALDGIPVAPEELDRDPMLLTVANGVIDLHTGQLREARREDLCTRRSPVVYDPDARLPLWDEFLERTIGGDPELAAYLQRAAGYSLTGRTDEDALLFVHGPGDTGKSTFIKALQTALGSDNDGYCTVSDFETFVARRDAGGVRNDIARLAGARMVTSIEVDEGKRLAEGVVKTMTGGDTVTARRLYEEFFEFRPVCKLWLVANHRPKSRPPTRRSGNASEWCPSCTSSRQPNATRKSERPCATPRSPDRPCWRGP